mgnify:CR=1 FL=1|tara:strand:+ start:373 stop:582 length:210 start_codon:yes stop_codon:yes gene_type:complete
MTDSSGSSATVTLQLEDGSVLKVTLDKWEMISLGGPTIDVASGDLDHEPHRVVITGYIGSKCIIDSQKP